MAGTCSMSLPPQEVTPEHLLGRVTSAFWTVHYAAAPIGAAVLTWAAERRGTAPGRRGGRRVLRTDRGRGPADADTAVRPVLSGSRAHARDRALNR
ncbi:hypothetical protein ACRAWF_16695 [Streptomyces sp. L7]